MSRLDGGIFSKPRGTTAGIVFGGARTRQGKVVTSRQYVIPSNPNTAAQQIQRTKFSAVQQILKQLGPECYQVNWNRSVGQLAGYNSLQSILLLQMGDNSSLSLVNTVNLGSLHFPQTVTPSTTGSTNVTVTWSDDLGPDGNDDDIVSVILIARTDTNRANPGAIQYDATAVRSAGTLSLTVPVVGTYEIYFYLTGDIAANLGLCSLAKPYSQEVV